ncbi:aminotransferase class I/II-fold pyridoxal phosphate-dependent enzyme [Gordonia soli]|nr:aminotransferase class I/II-fold pyridoxal phosphate-dependent enzyme [Gordonia soli]
MEFGRRAAEMEVAGTDVVKLNIGEPDFGAPPEFLAAVRELTDGRPLPYTDALGMPRLRQAIADFHAATFGTEIDPRRVAVTSGASAALLLCTAALVDPGDEVLVGDPSYPCNRQFAQSFGARVTLIPTSKETRFQLTADAVVDAWTPATRGVMVATPSNPTGTSIPAAELEQLCAAAADRGGWRIVDEIYLALADHDATGTAPHSVLATDPDAIVVNSFSKYFGLTGWRLGWCIVPDPLVPIIERLAQNYYICPPTPAQFAALTCFSPDTLALAEDRRRILRERRDVVLDGFAHIGLDVPVSPDGAFYLYVDVTSTGLTSAEFCDRALTEAHVALTPGKDFGTVGADDHVRVSYATSTDRLEAGIERLGQFVAGLRR